MYASNIDETVGSLTLIDVPPAGPPERLTFHKLNIKTDSVFTPGLFILAPQLTFPIFFLATQVLRLELQRYGDLLPGESYQVNTEAHLEVH